MIAAARPCVRAVGVIEQPRARRIGRRCAQCRVL